MNSAVRILLSATFLMSLQACENNDNSDTTPETAPVAAEQPNTAPLALSNTFVVTEGETVTLTLNGFDSEGDALSYAITTPPSHGTIGGTAPRIAYTPTEGYVGRDVIVFSVSDGKNGSAQAEVLIHVLERKKEPVAVNHVPVALPGAFVAIENAASEYTLSGYDINNDTLTFEITAAPAHGSLSGTPPKITYTPNENFSGTDTFTFSAKDAQLTSAPADISIQVVAKAKEPVKVNHTPIALPSTYLVNEDEATSFALRGFDSDNDALSYEIVTPAEHGTLSGNAPDLTYTPKENFVGKDAITFRVNDGKGNSENAEIRLHVINVNDAPVAKSNLVSVTENESVAFELSATDIDSKIIDHFTIMQQPANGRLTGTLPKLTYTPNKGFEGDDVIKFQVDDGEAYSETAEISLKVVPSPNLTFEFDNIINHIRASADSDKIIVVLHGPDGKSIEKTLTTTVKKPFVDFGNIGRSSATVSVIYHRTGFYTWWDRRANDLAVETYVDIPAAEQHHIKLNRRYADGSFVPGFCDKRYDEITFKVTDLPANWHRVELSPSWASAPSWWSNEEHDPTDTETDLVVNNLCAFTSAEGDVDLVAKVFDKNNDMISYGLLPDFDPSLPQESSFSSDEWDEDEDNDFTYAAVISANLPPQSLQWIAHNTDNVSRIQAQAFPISSGLIELGTWNKEHSGTSGVTSVAPYQTNRYGIHMSRAIFSDSENPEISTGDIGAWSISKTLPASAELTFPDYAVQNTSVTKNSITWDVQTTSEIDAQVITFHYWGDYNDDGITAIQTTWTTILPPEKRDWERVELPEPYATLLNDTEWREITLHVEGNTQTSSFGPYFAALTDDKFGDDYNGHFLNVTLPEMPKKPLLRDLSLSPRSVVIKEGFAYTLSYDYTLQNQPPFDREIELDWHSQDTSVATVDAGKVTGVSAGITSIHAKYGTLRTEEAPAHVAVICEGIQLQANGGESITGTINDFLMLRTLRATCPDGKEFEIPLYPKPNLDITATSHNGKQFKVELGEYQWSYGRAFRILDDQSDYAPAGTYVLSARIEFSNANEEETSEYLLVENIGSVSLFCSSYDYEILGYQGPLKPGTPQQLSLARQCGNYYDGMRPPVELVDIDLVQWSLNYNYGNENIEISDGGLLLATDDVLYNWNYVHAYVHGNPVASLQVSTCDWEYEISGYAAPLLANMPQQLSVVRSGCGEQTQTVETPRIGWQLGFNFGSHANISANGVLSRSSPTGDGRTEIYATVDGKVVDTLLVYTK